MSALVFFSEVYYLMLLGMSQSYWMMLIPALQIVCVVASLLEQRKYLNNNNDQLLISRRSYLVSAIVSVVLLIATLVNMKLTMPFVASIKLALVALWIVITVKLIAYIKIDRIIKHTDRYYKSMNDLEKLIRKRD